MLVGSFGGTSTTPPDERNLAFRNLTRAVMIELASAFVPGFHILSFASDFWGGVILSILNMLLKWLVLPPRREEV